MSDDSKRWILPHVISYWIGAAIIAVGGSWCRSYNDFIPCPNNETMSIECLLHVQSDAYRGVYIMHYIGLAWNMSHWLLDGMQIASWVLSRKAADGARCARCSLLYSPFHARSPVYFGIVLICVVITSITWVFIFKWSTNDGLSALAALLVAEITLTGLISAGLLRVARTSLQREVLQPAPISHDKMIERCVRYPIQRCPRALCFGLDI